MATAIPTEPSEPLTRSVRDIVRLKRRAPEQFTAGDMPDGSVWVRGPGAVAVYAPHEWLAKFARHVELGIFDAPRRNG